jgi:nifR3 family TIM-barrel protein
MRLGPLEIPNPWILAPMAGVSEMPFRVIALQFGAGLAPTELVSCAGLTHASERTLRYLRHDAARERPFVVQVFGGDPDEMAEAACIVKAHGADAIDINMGCPVPKVTRGGAGSALLCDPSRAARIVERMREASGLPVSVKIRAGWDARSVNAPEMARALEDAGAFAVALHARTRAQGYTGRADWPLIGRVKQAVRAMPVIGNGDVRTPDDARRMVRETGCDAVMIGRAALGDPWIFRRLAGGAPPDPDERGDLVLRHFDAHLAFARTAARPDDPGGDRRGVHQFRKHLLWYSRGLRGAVEFRKRVINLEPAEAVREAVASFFSSAPPERGERPDGAYTAEDAEFDARGALG